MGRFVHEAIAVDPHTGIVYETEDQMTAGVYRFLPVEVGNLAAGGRLEMLAIDRAPRAVMHAGQEVGVWAAGHVGAYRRIPIRPASVRKASTCRGRRGRRRPSSGVWRASGTADGRVYIVSTIGGNAGVGQVWEYDPSGERLRLFFESPDRRALELPDNLCVSPHGGLMLCEDSREENFVRWLAPDGRIFPFARNNVVLHGERNGIVGDFRAREFAGRDVQPRWPLVLRQRAGAGESPSPSRVPGIGRPLRLPDGDPIGPTVGGKGRGGSRRARESVPWDGSLQAPNGGFDMHAVDLSTARIRDVHSRRGDCVGVPDVRLLLPRDDVVQHPEAHHAFAVHHDARR